MSTTTDSELPLHGLSSGPEVVVMRRSISIPSQLSLLDTWGSLPAGVLFPLSPMAFAAAAAPTTEDRPPAAPDVPPNPRTARTEGDTLVGSISRTGMRESGQTRAVSDTDASDVWPPPGPAAHNTPPQHPRTTENIGVAPELRRVAEMVRCNQSRLESMVLSVSPPKANVERPVRAALPRSLAHEPDHPDHPDHTDHTDHPDHPGLPEHRAGRYDLQTKIGGGAFSNIYAAVDLEGSSIVAIKVINTLPSFLSSVDGEFAIMSSLDHKNVVKCLGRYQWNLMEHLVFELADEGDLFDRLEHFDDQDEAVCEQYMQQAAAGLIYLHDRNIVHFDLKLENMLLHQNVIKLCDFGLSGIDGSIRRGKPHGTSAYMPPELIKLRATDQTYTVLKSADVWSFAIVLHAVMFADLPWASALSSDRDYADFVSLGPRARASQPWSLLATDFREVVLAMLSPNPEDRPDVATVTVAIGGEWLTDYAMRDPEEEYASE